MIRRHRRTGRFSGGTSTRTLLARPDGALAGSVSGGCVESAAVEESGLAILRGTPRLTRFAVSDETAWGVGLACGGTIEVLIEPSLRPEVLSAAAGEEEDALDDL